MIVRAYLKHLFTGATNCVLCTHAFCGKSDCDTWSKHSTIRCTGFGENPLLLPTDHLDGKTVTTPEENRALLSNRYARKIVAGPDKGKITGSTFPLASQVSSKKCEPFEKASAADLCLRFLDYTVMSLHS